MLNDGNDTEIGNQYTSNNFYEVNTKHMCAKCGQEIPDNDLVYEDITKRERFGRLHRTITIGRNYYHRHCFNEISQERNNELIKEKKAQGKKRKLKCFGWSIPIGIVALVISFLSLYYFEPNINLVLTILYSILIGYGVFSMIYCIICGSYIGDVFVWCSKLSIKFPGLIFSWSFDGIMWLIGMKILFAIVGFLIGVAAFLLAIVISALLGGVSFPFILIHNIRTNYEDTL